jgi:hypothetical protein
LVAVRKVNVPLVLMAGAVAKLKFVPDVTVNVQVWLLSLVGPTLRLGEEAGVGDRTRVFGDQHQIRTQREARGIVHGETVSRKLFVRNSTRRRSQPA